MPDKILPTAALLRELFTYDPSSGILRWRFPLSNRVKFLSEAGSVNGAGYLAISIGGQHFYVHQVAWCLYSGEWPLLQIDHRDGNPSNNRISNLRLATESQNRCNQGLRPDNTSGTKGVSWSKDRKKWHAYISVDGQRTTLGWFESKGDAVAARKAAEPQFHGEFAKV